MNNIESKSLQVVLSAACTMLAYYIGAVAVPVIVLCAVMVIDYATGMISAWKSADLSSKKGIFGIIKKVCYLVLVCVGMGVDWLIYCGMAQIGIKLNYTIFFGVLVTVWLIINELISILENLKNIGVPLPKFLLTIVKKLKTTTEKISGSEEKKNEKGN